MERGTRIREAIEERTETIQAHEEARKNELIAHPENMSRSLTRLYLIYSICFLTKIIRSATTTMHFRLTGNDCLLLVCSNIVLFLLFVVSENLNNFV